MVQILFRLPQELLDRVDALMPVLSGNPELRAWGRTSRAAVLRLVILKGLEVIEAEHADEEG